jgi:ABC-type transport system substrate-binding protein
LTDTFTGHGSPQLDALIDAQSREFDPDERQRLVLEAQRVMLREHGPQITLPSGYDYTARWAYVHFPYEDGEAPPPDVLPYGCDIWTEKG